MGEKMNSCIEVLFNKMENFISTKTVVGEPINIGGVIIVPLVDVSFGVGAGEAAADSDKSDKKNKNEGGGGGLGAKITPAAVLVIMNGSVQLVNVKSQDSVNKLIDMVPGILQKLNLGSIFKKKEEDETVTFESDKTAE